MTMQITGVRLQSGSLVEIVCSECGPVARVAEKFVALRMLAHYHRHQSEAD